MAQVEAATSEIVTGEKSGRIDTRQTSVLAAICLAAGIAFLVYLLVAGLDTIGRHMLVISLVRLSFLAGLIAFAASVRRSEGLFHVGLLLAAVSAALNMAGAFAWVVTDGWSYNAFDTDGTGFPPWYAFMIGGSAFLFALGTILTGIAAIRTRAKPVLALAVLLAGLLYPLAIPLGATGHAIWTLPWLAVGILTLAACRESAPAARAQLT